jgi:REP element-mobilizing transposase RayT
MPQNYRVFSDKHYAYFVTCTVVEWAPIFARATYRQIVLDSLAYLREHKQTQLNAFVVMSTHLHLVLWPDMDASLSDVLRDFKRFTSRAISKEAHRAEDRQFLEVFALARQQGRAQETSQYQVWQEGSHPEAIYTLEFARQKIEYIHNNPVKAGMVSTPEEWLYSSARAYLKGEETHPKVDLLEIVF